jgi:hypothetical protein
MLLMVVGLCNEWGMDEAISGLVCNSSLKGGMAFNPILIYAPQGKVNLF